MFWIAMTSALGIALVLIVPPLFAGGAANPHSLPPRRPSRVKGLREEKASALLALRELDFEYEVGKLSAADYKEIRAKYESQAVLLMRELEEAETEWKAAVAEVDEILRSRLGISAPTISSPEGKAFCHRCGGILVTHDRFCASCGAVRKQVVAS